MGTGDSGFESRRSDKLSTKFKRKLEDFVCENCNIEVKGNGYTNHCPGCLFSKHVDVTPGDRLAGCGGLMKPINIEGTEKEYVLTHKCVTCNHTKRNKVANNDSIDVLVQIAKKKGNLSK